MALASARPLLLAMALAVAGCADAPLPPAPTPSAAPPAAPAPEPITLRPPASQDLLARYYAALERRLLAEGKLRRDPGPRRIAPHILARNFADIALRDEYALTDGRLAASGRETGLRRWEQPIRWSLHTGPAMPAPDARAARAETGRYLARLARLTGHDIAPGADANLQIFFLSDAELRGARDRFAAFLGPVGRATLDALTDLERDTYCMAAAISRPMRYDYDRAIIIIRAEHPALFRSACIHEELAQAMGLANDSPEARHSIFNDDDAYALLTHHDELLLRILYDPRLKPGMRRAEAEPIARQIAQELLGAGT